MKFKTFAAWVAFLGVVTVSGLSASIIILLLGVPR